MAQCLISGERELTYDALEERRARAANAFKARGIGPGQRVALILRNDFAFIEASGAVSAAGAHLVPINWSAAPEEIGYILEDSMAKAIVVHADLYRDLCWVFP